MNIVQTLEKFENNDGKIIARQDHDLKDVLNFVGNCEENKTHLLRTSDGKIFEFKF